MYFLKCRVKPYICVSLQKPDSRKLVKAQDWNSFTDVKATSVFAPDQVKNFVIFDIGGNKYSLITCINYKTKVIYIREFLTHAEYDRDKWKNDEGFDS